MGAFLARQDYFITHIIYTLNHFLSLMPSRRGIWYNAILHRYYQTGKRLSKRHINFKFKDPDIQLQIKRGLTNLDVFNGLPKQMNSYR